MQNNAVMSQNLIVFIVETRTEIGLTKLYRMPYENKALLLKYYLVETRQKTKELHDMTSSHETMVMRHQGAKKSGYICMSDSVKEILTCPNLDAFVPVMQKQHFCHGSTCPSDIELANIRYPNQEFALPGYSDSYFIARGEGSWTKLLPLHNLTATGIKFGTSSISAQTFQN